MQQINGRTCVYLINKLNLFLQRQLIMGEYARRKSDNAEIKIGTCEDMYYLRYEDRDKVICDSGSGFGTRWRLPLPSEDHILPGNYEHPYFRGNGRIPIHLAKVVGDDGDDERIYFEPNMDVADHPGLTQLRNGSGLLVNIKCFHGLKLPEAGGDITSIHWNGKTSHWWDLVCLRETEEGLHPVVQCRQCGHMYRETWPAVLDFIKDKELKRRLMTYATTLVVC